MKSIIILAIAILITSCTSSQKSTTMDKSKQSKVYIGIGYYLKTTDILLTEKMDKIHDENNMTRAEWQILHAIFETPEVSRDTLLKTVKEFTSVEMASILIDKLLEKKWIEKPAKLILTVEGVIIHTNSLKMQKEFRTRITTGITQEEYQNVINTLDKMIHNLQQE